MKNSNNQLLVLYTSELYDFYEVRMNGFNEEYCKWCYNDGEFTLDFWKQYSEFGGDRCFGIAANTTFLLMCTYEENGNNPELVVYKKR